jgi:hypothetical protein
MGIATNYEAHENTVKSMSDQQIMQGMQNPNPSGPPPFMLLVEANIRKEMRDEQTRQEGLGQPTVLAQLTGAAPASTPQTNVAGMPQGVASGMAQSMAPKTNVNQNTGINTVARNANAAAPVATMASGGILKMATAGEVESGFIILNTPPITRFGEVVTVNADTLEKLTDKYPDIMAQANAKELVVPAGSEKGQNIVNSPMYKSAAYRYPKNTETGYLTLVRRVDETEPNMLKTIQENAKNTVAKIKAADIVVATEPTSFMDLDTVDTPGEADRMYEAEVRNASRDIRNAVAGFSPNLFPETVRPTEVRPMPIYADDDPVYNDGGFNEKLRGIPSVIRDTRIDGNVLQGPAERAGDYLGAMSGVQAGVDYRAARRQEAAQVEADRQAAAVRAEADRQAAIQKRGIMSVADSQAAEVDRQAAEKALDARYPNLKLLQPEVTNEGLDPQFPTDGTLLSPTEALQRKATRVSDRPESIRIDAGDPGFADVRAAEEIERKRRINAKNIIERVDESAVPIVDRFPPLSKAELGAMGSTAAEAYLQNMRGEKGSVTGYNEVMLPAVREMTERQLAFRRGLPGYGYGDGPDKQAGEYLREYEDFMSEVRSADGEVRPYYLGQDGLKPQYTYTTPTSYKGLDRFEKPDARETRAGIAAYSPSVNPSILNTPVSLEYIQSNPELLNEYMFELRKENAEDPALADAEFKRRLAADKAKTDAFAARKTTESDAVNTPKLVVSSGSNVDADGNLTVKTGDSYKDIFVDALPSVFDRTMETGVDGIVGGFDMLKSIFEDAAANSYGSDPYDPKNLNESIGPAAAKKLRDDAKETADAYGNVPFEGIKTPGLTDATRKTLTEQGFKPSTPMPVIGDGSNKNVNPMASRASDSPSSYEQKLLDILAEREKSADQDKWLGLAEMGMRLMASSNPNLLSAIGESGLGAFGSYRKQQAGQDAEELNILSKLADLDMAQQTLQARRDIAAANRSNKDGFTFSQAVNTQQERLKLVTEELANMQDPLGNKLEGVDRAAYDKKVNEAAAINADLQRLYKKGNLGSSDALATALENVQIDSTK